MTDKEMLELAAKAGDLEIIGWTQDGNGIHVAILCDGTRWQPLHENQLTDHMGDVWRLAVKLRITVHHFDDSCAAANCFRFYSEPNDDDERAATCRAIVRAAADLEEGMSSVTERPVNLNLNININKYY